MGKDGVLAVILLDVVVNNYLDANKVQSSKLTVLTRHAGQLEEAPIEGLITQRNENASSDQGWAF
jgi:hypothetical protein